MVGLDLDDRGRVLVELVPFARSQIAELRQDLFEAWRESAQHFSVSNLKNIVAFLREGARVYESQVPVLYSPDTSQNGQRASDGRATIKAALKAQAKAEAWRTRADRPKAAGKSYRVASQGRPVLSRKDGRRSAARLPRPLKSRAVSPPQDCPAGLELRAGTFPNTSPRILPSALTKTVSGRSPTPKRAAEGDARHARCLRDGILGPCSADHGQSSRDRRVIDIDSEETDSARSWLATAAKVPSSA